MGSEYSGNPNPIQAGPRRLRGLRALSYEDLKLYTNGFSEEKLIGKTQFGKVYHGRIPQGSNGMEAREVTVKIWEDPEIYRVDPGDDRVRLYEEIDLLKDRRLTSHPNIVKLIGCCSEGEQLGVVYDLKSLNTVYNLILKDAFTWLQRIKVAVQFACLLEFLHTPVPPCLPFLVRNIDPAHIMVDEDHNPKLIDFGMFSGGILLDRRDFPDEYVYGCYGYVDPHYATVGGWSEANDVFAFGVVLLGLIAKKVFDPVNDRKIDCDIPFVDKWAWEEYKPKKSVLGFGGSKCSLVHKSLAVEPVFYPTDGPKITKLAMRCVEYYPRNRPTMKQVVQCLLNLRVVQHHADVLGIDQMLLDRYPNPWKAKFSGSCLAI